MGLGGEFFDHEFIASIDDPTRAIGATAAEIMLRVGDKMQNISDKLRREMPKGQYEALIALVGDAKTRDLLDIDQMLQMVRPMAAPAGPVQIAQTRNYEAAIFSRLQVIAGDKHSFDMIKVHRTREGKFFVFVIVHDKWVVLEDDELFPSDKLISALRCLTI